MGTGEWRRFERFKLDRRETSGGTLATPPVMGPLDPGEDGEPQLLVSLPVSQRRRSGTLPWSKESGLVATGPTRGPIDPGRAPVLRGLHEGLGPDLRPSVRVHHRVGAGPPP